MTKYFLSFLCLAVLSCKPKTTEIAKVDQPEVTNNQKKMEYTSVHDFKMSTIEGKQQPLSEYKGKVMLIVNVASQCGLTPQYAELQELYNNFAGKGLVVLGFPANNFMGQEPGTNDEIKSFCSKNYGVTFPMFAKISVKGEDTHALYQYLTQKSQNGVFDSEVTWNFQKFLVDKEGKVITSFSPKTSVTDPAVITAISKALGE